MNHLSELIILSPEEEATRLWEGAQRAQEQAVNDLVALCESLDLGLRAAEILVTQKLQPVKDQFPATIGLLLETPHPEVNPHRDAVTVPKSLQFTDLLDLLSEEMLDCIGPGIHRGWEDRTLSCRRSRKTAQEVIEVTLSSNNREQLMLLAAYRNRLFRYHRPVEIHPQKITSAFTDLSELMRGLHIC